MIGIKPTHSFAVTPRATKPTTGARVASDLFETIDLALAEVGTSTIVSADIEAAIKGTAQPIPFNMYAPGSAEWYEHGKETGIWVTGRTIGELKRASSERHWTLEQVMTEAAAVLQELNDRFARLDAEGASRSELMSVARRTVPTPPSGELYLDVAEGSGVGDDFARLYHGMRLLAANNMADNILARDDWGVGGRQRVRAWGAAAMVWMDTAIRDLELEPEDGQQRRAQAFDEAMQRRREVAAQIATLPLEAQRAAWDYFFEGLDARLTAAEGEPRIERRAEYLPEPEAPEPGPEDWIDAAVQSKDFKVDAERSRFAAQMAKEQVTVAANGLATDARSGVSRALDEAAGNAVQNLRD